MTTEQLESFPANANPFHHDPYNMGTPIGNNVMIMYDCNSLQPCDYIVIVNVTTG